MTSFGCARRAFGGLTETLWAAGVVGVVLAFALRAAEPALLHVRLSEPLFLVSSARIGMHEQHAISGVWPDASRAMLTGSSAAPISEYVRDITAAGAGAVQFDLQWREEGAELGRLSMRAAQTSYGLSPVIVVCGYAPLPAPYEAKGVNETNIPEHALPAPCRRRGPAAAGTMASN